MKAGLKGFRDPKVVNSNFDVFEARFSRVDMENLYLIYFKC